MKRQLIDMGIIFTLLLVIGLGAIALLFQPATIQYEAFDQFGVKSNKPGTYAPNAQTSLGLALRGKAWLKYPEYNIGLGCIASLAFSGAGYIAWSMVSMREQWEKSKKEAAPT